MLVYLIGVVAILVVCLLSYWLAVGGSIGAQRRRITAHRSRPSAQRNQQQTRVDSDTAVDSACLGKGASGCNSSRIGNGHRALYQPDELAVRTTPPGSSPPE
jgi:hypothetical protein